MIGNQNGTQVTQFADYVADDIAFYVDRAKALLREVPNRSGGSLRLLAFQVKDAMDDLIRHIDGSGDVDK